MYRADGLVVQFYCYKDMRKKQHITDFKNIFIQQ